MSLRYKAKRRERYYRKLRRCQYKGCTSEGIACFLPENYSGQPDEFYCGEHAHAVGYCRCCGQFWGGICSFDFRRSGFCDHCHDQVMANSAELDDNAEYWEATDPHANV